MYCTICSFPLEDGDVFCAQCGGRTMEGNRLGRRPGRALARAARGKKLSGVCAGFARYFDVDVTLVRVGWTVASLVPFMPGLVAYAICWAVMPSDEKVASEAASQ